MECEICCSIGWYSRIPWKRTQLMERYCVFVCVVKLCEAYISHHSLNTSNFQFKIFPRVLPSVAIVLRSTLSRSRHHSTRTKLSRYASACVNLSMMSVHDFGNCFNFNSSSLSFRTIWRRTHVFSRYDLLRIAYQKYSIGLLHPCRCHTPNSASKNKNKMDTYIELSLHMYHVAHT